jgi:hypothetical protein
MTQSLIRLMVTIAFGSFSIVKWPLLRNVLGSGKGWSGSFAANGILLVCLATIATVGFYYALKKVVSFIDASAKAQARFLDTLNAKYADAAFLFSAALSLFLELAIIRWKSSVLPFFAFYKNFSLLACFVGLGMGYALAARDHIPFAIVLPLLTWQFSFMPLVGYGPDSALITIPFREQLTMGLGVGDLLYILFTIGLLAIVFLITALTFMPVGQLCGRPGTPHQVAGLWTELAPELTRRPSHARGEFFMDASARLVRTVFPCNSVIYVENAFSNDGRTFFHGRLHDHLRRLVGI